MSERILLAFVAVVVPMLAVAQGPRLEFPSFTHLQQKAIEVVDIDIGSWPLGIASWLMDDEDPDSAEMKQVLKGLKAVRVRSYQFESDNEYSKGDVDAVRSQLSGQGWRRLVQVRKRNSHEDVDVYVNMDKDKVAGFAIVASEPREFTIVNIVGTIDIKQVARLQKQLNLPEAAMARADESPTDPRVP